MIDQLNPIVIQIVRTVWQAVWSAIISTAVVANFLDSVELDPVQVEAVLFPLVMGLMILAGRALEKVSPIFGIIFNGIPAQPEYSRAA